MRGQRFRYLPQRLPLSVQLAHQRDHLRHLLSIRETTAAASTCRDLALPRRSQLGNQVRLLKLADGPRTCLTSTAVGVSVVKKSGADVGTSSTPSERR